MLRRIYIEQNQMGLWEGIAMVLLQAYADRSSREMYVRSHHSLPLISSTETQAWQTQGNLVFVLRLGLGIRLESYELTVFRPERRDRSCHCLLSSPRHVL